VDEHAAQEVEAAEAAYVPAAQLTQLVEPATEEYLPATQFTHWVPAVVSL